MTLSVARYMRIGLITLAVLVGGFGTWAVFAELGGAIVASGRIEVDQNRQVVQHPYGGQVAEIFVDEGDTVTQNDILVRLDGSELQSQLTVVSGQLSETIARRNRLEAERDGATEITFDPELAGETELTQGQTRLFDARLTNNRTQAEQYRRRIDQIRQQINGVTAQQSSLDVQLALIEQELADQQSLLERGLAQAARVLALQREQASLQGQKGELTATIAQAEGRITEIELGILNIDALRREEAIAELRELQPLELELRETRNALLNQLDRLDIRAGVGGIVYGLQVYSTSAVIQPAEPVLYIVPQDRPLIITTRIDPRDIDQVLVGQAVKLRFSTFDQKTTPELIGTVVNVSGDAFEDSATGQSFYRAEVILNEGEIEKLPDGKTLIPGMPVESFIRTTDRTPLQFLLKPMTDFFARAWREE